MTYIPCTDIAIKAADSPSIDAFDRLRVSNPQTIFNSKQLWDKCATIYDEVTTGSGTTSTFTANNSCVNMAVSASTAGSITRQTFRRFNYQPGKSQLLFLTGNMYGLSAGNKKQVGMFTDKNGLFFEIGSTANVVIRTYTSGSAVDTKIAQANWNVDPMDGTGPSGVTIDWTKVQIFVIDFEWLGVGRVRFGLVNNGIVHYVHYQSAANNGTAVYMTTPNLPIRYRIENDGSGGATSMDHICATVITEGGIDPTGYQESIATDAGGDSHTTGHIDCIFAIRLKSTRPDAIVKIIDYSGVGTSRDDILLFQSFLNPTIAGSVAWDTTSFDEVDVLTGTPGTSTITGGTLLSSQVGVSRSPSTRKAADSGEGIGVDLSGTSDVYALGLSVGSNSNVCVALNWEVLK